MFTSALSDLKYHNKANLSAWTPLSYDKGLQLSKQEEEGRLKRLSSARRRKPVRKYRPTGRSPSRLAKGTAYTEPGNEIQHSFYSAKHLINKYYLLKLLDLTSVQR